MKPYYLFIYSDGTDKKVLDIDQAKSTTFATLD